MNRLILVGNGFDLAHGLKTSYKDFIDDFWKNQIEEIKKFIKTNKSENFENTFIEIVYPKRLPQNLDSKNFKELINDLKYYHAKLFFKNNFLEILTEKYIDNWIDIENEYYNELKKSKNIDELNSNFREIKQLLTDYINKIDKKIKTKEKIINNVNQELNVLDFSQEFLSNHIQYLLKRINELKTSSQISIFESYNKTIRDFINKIYYNKFNKDYVHEILKSILKQKSNECFDFLEFKIKKSIFFKFQLYRYS